MYNSNSSGDNSGGNCDPEINKVITDYNKFVKQPRSRRSNYITMSIPQNKVKVSTIQYLRKHGYNCQLVGATEISYWYIIKDDIEVDNNNAKCCCFK
jgi:hypothetical protein